MKTAGLSWTIAGLAAFTGCTVGLHYVQKWPAGAWNSEASSSRARSHTSTPAFSKG